MLHRRVMRLPLFVSVFSILFFLYETGFVQQNNKSFLFEIIYQMSILFGCVSLLSRYFFLQFRPKLKILPIDLLLLAFLSLIFIESVWPDTLFVNSFLKQGIWLRLAIFVVFFREFTDLKLDIKRAIINPAQLFLFSFFFIIIIGTLLLLLPNATHRSISLIDAMFTSTSAVCVTGLVVVDTGTYFTQFGQIIILILLQIGGIGIMTFASYFSYFFRGGATYENQLILREMTNIDKLAEVFAILKKIILITFFIEFVGAFFIYQTIDQNVIPMFKERLFFSVFHSVSGFCNAGFSTLEHNFFDLSFRFNYGLQLVIASLIVLGGIGFPIVFNLIKYIKIKVKSFFLIMFRKKRMYTPWLININTRIVLITSFVLIVGGTLLLFVFEYNTTLTDHHLAGKIITAFFSSVTTRTAGFNTIDFSALTMPATLIVIFLMWVGASPGSTGGGIKTSTLAVAILNIISIAKAKSRLEVFKREIPIVSINRAFAIIVLSVLVISLSVLFVMLIQPNFTLTDVLFECVSAYSTVGLSRGITADLHVASKFVIICTMFLGRIGTLTFLIAIFKKVSSEKYQLPSENILIN